MRLGVLVVMAVLIGCSSSDGEQLERDDAGARSTGRVGAGFVPGDEDDQVGKLSKRRDSGMQSDAGERHAEADAGEAAPPSGGATAPPPGKTEEESKAEQCAVPGTQFGCFAGSCTRCPESNAAGTGGSSAGSSGSSPNSGSGWSAPPSCPDQDTDGVCDAADVCPGGSDEDADHNGYLDGCDQVLFEARLLPTTQVIDALTSQVGGAYGDINASTILLESPPFKTPTTWSVEASDPKAETAAAYFTGTPWSSSASICISGPSGVSGACWWSRGEYADLTRRTVTRFVLVIDELSTVQHPGDYKKSDVRAGGRWEIRGY